MFWLWIMASVFSADAADDQNLPHAEYCNLYYTVGHCPPGEHFSVNEGFCNLPQYANCKITGEDITAAPSGDLSAFPHPKSCEKFYYITLCPGEFNFNPTSNACDSPKSKGCPSEVTGCSKLDLVPDINIKPFRCTDGENKIGDVCTFECKNKTLQAMGTTSLTCTKSGWKSEGSFVTPHCVGAIQVAQSLLDDMSKELEDTEGGILFVMDESGSITARNFEREKQFIKGVIGRLPLSANRSAGVILFSDKSRVEISLRTKNTCSFYKQVEGMKYRGGGTNISLALEKAQEELLNTHHHKKAVVLLTDGQSPNATEVADEMKSSGARIFTIGVTGHDEKALAAMASINEDNKVLFYPVSSMEAFESIAQYLEGTYADNITSACIREANSGVNPRI